MKMFEQIPVADLSEGYHVVIGGTPYVVVKGEFQQVDKTAIVIIKAWHAEANKAADNAAGETSKLSSLAMAAAYKLCYELLENMALQKEKTAEAETDEDKRWNNLPSID